MEREQVLRHWVKFLRLVGSGHPLSALSLEKYRARSVHSFAEGPPRRVVDHEWGRSRTTPGLDV